MMADYIPGADAEFCACQQSLVMYGIAHLPDLGLVGADLTPLTAAIGGPGLRADGMQRLHRTVHLTGMPSATPTPVASRLRMRRTSVTKTRVNLMIVRPDRA